MARPHPLIGEPSSCKSSTREVVMGNPSLAPPSALTPGLTPFPYFTTSRAALGTSGKRPWVVAPPPPTIPKNIDTSSRGWLSGNSSRRGLCATVVAVLLLAVLFVVVLGAYAVLVYLAVTTRRPKYIAFSSCIGGVFLLVAGNVLLSGEPGGTGGLGGRERTASEEEDEVRRAYGLKS